MRWLASQALPVWLRRVSAAAVICPGVWFCAAPAAPTDTLTLELEYKVFIRGVRVGAARVHAETGNGRYRVCGRMHTTDIWARIAPWEARFDVRGRTEEGRAMPEVFRMRERAGKRKDRIIHVEAGVLRQVLNGERQEDAPAPDGVDLMSFFWVTARCDAEVVLNNGRKSYAMMLRERTVANDGAQRCDYDVLDKDGDVSPARFDMVDRHGRRVARTVTMPATLRRQLRLVDAVQIDATADRQACSLADWNPDT